VLGLGPAAASRGGRVPCYGRQRHHHGPLQRGSITTTMLSCCNRRTGQQQRSWPAHVHSSIPASQHLPAAVLLTLVVAHDGAHACPKGLPVAYCVVLLEALRVQLARLEGLQQEGRSW
jgi:hypothetical protein